MLKLKINGSLGPNWISSFMKSQQMSLEEATKLCTARLNPFIVYHWFDLLEKKIEELGIKDRPDLIWNSYESGLQDEPKKCKVVSARGKKSVQIVTGSDRDNNAVLAAVSESGATLPPLIILGSKSVNMETYGGSKP